MDLPRGVYKTIILFLEKQGFTATSESLRKDVNISSDDFPKISPESLVLKAVGSNDVQLLNDNTDLKRQFLTLEEEHKKLMAVTTELTAALHNNMIGQTQQLNSMLESCKNIYPDLFVTDEPKQKINRTSAKENAREIIDSILSSATKSPREECQEILPDCFVIEDKLVNKLPESLAELDIELVKNNLLNASKDVKISLMKCLSWMLSSDQATKDVNIEISVKHDLLMFKNEVSLVETYLNDLELQECMLRLVKSLAFVIGGREYLWEEGHRVICDCFVALVKQRKSLILIATLQKLSLIPSARFALLNTELIHNLLNSYHRLPISQLTSYHWEYLMALLMNLCLQSDYTRSLPNDIVDKMFELFENLLRALNIHCLPYIVSILFNLLDHPGIVDNIRNRKLLLLLESCVNDVNICESIRNQLELIVNTIKNADEDKMVKLPKNTQLFGQESLDDCDKRLFCLDLISDVDVNVLNSFKKLSKDKEEKPKSNKVNRVKKRLSTSADLPFCYMELCTKLAGHCKCSKCNGGNRYTCRCYDILRNDLDLEETSTNKKQNKYQDLENEQCSSCERDEVCGYAAFESKPKIERTPP